MENPNEPTINGRPLSECSRQELEEAARYFCRVTGQVRLRVSPAGVRPDLQGAPAEARTTA